MATEPDPVEERPSLVVRARKLATSPVSTGKGRRALLFALAAGFAAGAVLPWGCIAAGIVAYLAFEAGWER